MITHRKPMNSYWMVTSELLVGASSNQIHFHTITDQTQIINHFLNVGAA